MTLPVLVIGAGPVGLAAAAHLLSRGTTPLVLEAGPAVAHNVRQWGHVGMFTPWRFCVDREAAKLLARHGWQHPPADDVPTGADLVSLYLEPLAAALAPYVEFNARVIAVTRKNADKVRTAGREDLPFVVRLAGPNGVRRIEAKAVIDASGTWGSPNPAGADGLPATGEEECAAQIASGIPDVLGQDRARYDGRTVAVVGSGHSATNALIELAALRETAPRTQILWLMRKESIETVFGGEAADALPERGALGIEARRLVETGIVEAVTPFRIAEITREGQRLCITGDHAGEPRSFTVDEIITATGFRPDLSMLREIRLALDPWLESAGSIGPLIDPNVHSCGTVRPHGAKELAHPEAGFFIAGMKSYGRAPTFLLATGHEQVRSIAAALAGDWDAAARVELELPETGVCSARPVQRAAEETFCCGITAVATEPVAACCAPPAAAETCCDDPRPKVCCAVPERETV